MGVVNVNPDSFSDPGPRTAEGVMARAAEAIEAGARILDVGAQSAITGRPPVEAAPEAAALQPVVAELVRSFPSVAVSVDTYKVAVADAVLAAGAHMLNDVSGLADGTIAEHCARHGAALVVMHTAAPPLTRRQDPGLYDDVASEVAAFLVDRAAQARAVGVPAESVVVDPGVDFSKTPAQSIELLRGIDAVAALGYPVLLALSRKDFVGALTGRNPAARDAGTLGAVAALRRVPRQILRVHDVAATADLLAVLDTLSSTDPVDAALALSDDLRHEP